MLMQIETFRQRIGTDQDQPVAFGELLRRGGPGLIVCPGRRWRASSPSIPGAARKARASGDLAIGIFGIDQDIGPRVTQV